VDRAEKSREHQKGKQLKVKRRLNKGREMGRRERWTSGGIFWEKPKKNGSYGEDLGKRRPRRGTDKGKGQQPVKMHTRKKGTLKNGEERGRIEPLLRKYSVIH